MSFFNVLVGAVLVATATAAAAGDREVPAPASPAETLTVQYVINMTTPGGFPIRSDGSVKVRAPLTHAPILVPEGYAVVGYHGRRN